MAQAPTVFGEWWNINDRTRRRLDSPRRFPPRHPRRARVAGPRPRRTPTGLAPGFPLRRATTRRATPVVGRIVNPSYVAAGAGRGPPTRPRRRPTGLPAFPSAQRHHRPRHTNQSWDGLSIRPTPPRAPAAGIPLGLRPRRATPTPRTSPPPNQPPIKSSSGQRTTDNGPRTTPTSPLNARHVGQDLTGARGNLNPNGPRTTDHPKKRSGLFRPERRCHG